MFTGTADNTTVNTREGGALPSIAHFPKKGPEVTSLNKQIVQLNKSRKSGAEIVKAKLMLLVSQKRHLTLNDFLTDPYVGDSFGAMLASLYGIVDEITVMTSGSLFRYTLAILNDSSPAEEEANATMQEQTWLLDHQPLFESFQKEGTKVKCLPWDAKEILESDAYEVQCLLRDTYRADPDIQQDLATSKAVFLDRLQLQDENKDPKRVDDLIWKYLFEEFLGVITRMRILFKDGYMGSVYTNGESQILKRARTVALEQIEKKNSIPEGRMVFWGWYTLKHQKGSLSDPMILARQARYRKPPIETYLNEQFPGVSFDQPLKVDELVKARKIFADYALNAFNYGLFVSKVKNIGIAPELNGSTRTMLAKMRDGALPMSPNAQQESSFTSFMQEALKTFKTNGAAGTAKLSTDGSMEITYHGPARPSSPTS